VDKLGYIDLGLRTSRPNASRVKIRVHVLLQSSLKLLISASWGVSEGGRGCWALPSLKSPKFMALVWLLVGGFQEDICMAGSYSLKSPVCQSCLVLVVLYTKELYDLPADARGQGFLYAFQTSPGSID
jgi:hypothetical protein